MLGSLQLKDIPLNLYLGCDCRVDGVSGFKFTGIIWNAAICYGEHEGTTHKMHAPVPWSEFILELRPMDKISSDEYATIKGLNHDYMDTIANYDDVYRHITVKTTAYLLKQGFDLNLIPKEYYVLV